MRSAWEASQHKSFEQLKQEADEQRAKRENVQPLKLGKVNYGSVFRVGDRTRSELALDLRRPEESHLGSGQVGLDELIPPQAFKDLEHALAQANVTAQAETMEGVREKITYDADEAEVLNWQEKRTKLVISPAAVEEFVEKAESGAFEKEGEDAL